MLKTENPQNDFIIRKLIKEQRAYLVVAKQKLEQANQETSAERMQRALAEQRAQEAHEQRTLAEQQTQEAHEQRVLAEQQAQEAHEQRVLAELRLTALQARLAALGVVDPNVSSNSLDPTAEMDSASKVPKHNP